MSLCVCMKRESWIKGNEKEVGCFRGGKVALGKLRHHHFV